MATQAKSPVRERGPFMKWLLNDKTQRVLIMVTFMAAPLVLLALFTARHSPPIGTAPKTTSFRKTAYSPRAQ